MPCLNFCNRSLLYTFVEGNGGHMTFNAARQPFSFSAVVFVLLAMLFAVRYAVVRYAVEAPFFGGMPAAASLSGFSVEYPWLAVISVVVLLMWTLFIIVQLTVRYASASSRNYLPMQFFLITACGVVIPGEALASFLAAWLLALSTRQFVSSFRKDFRFQEVFRAGFYLGFIPLFYAPGILLLLIIPLVLLLYRRSGRELAVCIVGAMMPVPGAGFLYWACGESPSFIYREIWRCVSERPPLDYPAQVPVVASVVAGIVVLLVLRAVVWYLTHRRGMRTRQRKAMAHVSLMLFVAFLSFLIPGYSPVAVPLLAIPVAMAVPYSFSGKRTWFPTLLYCLLLFAVLTLNLGPVLGISIP